MFLNVNELLEPRGTKMERIFITKIGYLNGDVLSVLKPAGFFDENEDGKDELFFSITSAFSMGPRKVFSYDLVNGKLNSSQFTGNICLEPKMVDADGDQKPEIFGKMSGSGNYTTNVPFSDSSTWFMVFNDKLKFKFPPVEFPGYVNTLEINAYDNGNFKGYVLSHRQGGTDTTVLKSRIMIFTSNGELVRYRLYSDFDNSGTLNLFVSKYHQSYRIYLITDKIIELNDKLETVRTIDLPFNSQTIQYQVDVNEDGEDEFMIYSNDEEKLAVSSGGLNKLKELKFKPPDPIWTFSQYYSKDHNHKLFLRSGTESYLLGMERNNFYYLGYLAYPGVYIMFFLFIALVKRINTYQVVQKESLKQRLIMLQLQGIKAQLDPHFTFNTLNSVASLIYLEDRQSAYDYMNKFTQLLRAMLNDAERIYRSLAEELDFVNTYLELEKLRFGNKFNYEIKIGEGVSQKELVPKMVLQTFAENAIKHGIMPCDEGGLLNIMINKENNYLRLTIEDNGIGRASAAGHSTSTGRGLKLTGEFYDILNQINKKPIKHLITDLYNSAGDAEGTRVEVWVPVGVGKNI
ncbi:MAG: hypothetical protein EPN88_01630 [Bacteroidetes bacterium]|nr:MAG: hypothetical protein EPN88_01630 [Bacteroidota bacterium]